MWLYFDDTGALITSLEHGPAARVGTTDFQIFAYFHNVDLNVFNTATIKFIKDDFNSASHPMLFMHLTRHAPFVLNTTNRETVQNVLPFEPGVHYTGFLFDFATFAEGQDVAVLLDTPGKWHAVITLYAGAEENEDGAMVLSRSIQSVQGTVEFYVEGPLFETDPYVASLDDVVSNIAREMAARRIYFISVNPDLETMEGTLSAPDLLKIKDNNLNRLVYNNIVYYYARTLGDTKTYYSIVAQTGGDANYNAINVNIETGHYALTTVHDKYIDDHINNTIVHITQAEREFWNNKVTTDDSNIAGEELILTRN